AAQKASERKQKAIAEAEGLRGVLEPMVRAGLSYRAMADALEGVGKVSSTGRPLAPAQIGRILQRLVLSGKSLGSDQDWVAA
ncbi:MAG: recombinase, partial [Synechococcus sp.]